MPIMPPTEAKNAFRGWTPFISVDGFVKNWKKVLSIEGKARI